MSQLPILSSAVESFLTCLGGTLKASSSSWDDWEEFYSIIGLKSWLIKLSSKILRKGEEDLGSKAPIILWLIVTSVL